MSEPTFFLVIGGIIILGLMATLLYYFARYYFRTHERGRELAKPPVPSEKGSPETESFSIPTEKKVKETLEGTSPSEPPLKDLREALSNTRNTLWGRIKGVMRGGETLSDDEMEALEEILYTSDLGPKTVQRLVQSVGEALPSSEKSDVEQVRQSLRSEMFHIFSSLEFRELDSLSELLDFSLNKSPHVWMVVGVNGAGKTTTIGKLAHQVVQSGRKVMVVAGDTFRAAADEQLKVWSQRAQVELFSPKGVTDPSAVAFDACSSAQAKKIDVVIVDTAGRLHTQNHLMEELKKMKRVIQKVLPEAPHEVFVVLDANSGQNALIQAKFFHESLRLTGAILTKLDGSAKGGVALGLACELQLPIKMIGVGEGLYDLRPFHSKEFIDSII